MICKNMVQVCSDLQCAFFFLQSSGKTRIPLKEICGILITEFSLRIIMRKVLGFLLVMIAKVETKELDLDLFINKITFFFHGLVADKILSANLTIFSR